MNNHNGYNGYSTCGMSGYNFIPTHIEAPAVQGQKLRTKKSPTKEPFGWAQLLMSQAEDPNRLGRAMSCAK